MGDATKTDLQILNDAIAAYSDMNALMAYVCRRAQSDDLWPPTPKVLLETGIRNGSDAAAILSIIEQFFDEKQKEQ